MDDIRQYEEMLVRARADENVLGVILSGSRAMSAFVTERSDFDCYIVVRDPDAGGWTHVRGTTVETVSLTAQQFADHAVAGSPTYWNRPSFLYARLDLDKTGGAIRPLLEAKRRLSPEEADLLVREWIDGYLNSLYRSLKNFRDGRTLAGALDAREPLSPLLTTVFALAGRVRPFNKYLGFELEREPLPISAFLPRLASLSDAPDMAAQQAMFREFESLARARGYDALVDDWHPDVPFFRGERVS